MRHLLKQTLINVLSILGLTTLLSGLTYSQNIFTLLSSAFVLALANALIKPLLKAIFLPLNVITLGLASWGINVIILYLVTLIVPGFATQPYSVELLNTAFYFNYFWSLVSLSFALSATITTVNWVLN